jgi:hypothetical protein
VNRFAAWLVGRRKKIFKRLSDTIRLDSVNKTNAGGSVHSPRQSLSEKLDLDRSGQSTPAQGNGREGVLPAEMEDLSAVFKVAPELTGS